MQYQSNFFHISIENFTLDWIFLHNQRLWWLWQIWSVLRATLDDSYIYIYQFDSVKYNLILSNPMSKEDYKRLFWCQTLLPKTRRRNQQKPPTRICFGFLPDFFLDFSVILFWISQTLQPKSRRRYQQRPTTRRKNFDIDYFYDYDYPINAEEPSRKVEQRLWTILQGNSPNKLRRKQCDLAPLKMHFPKKNWR